MSEIDLQFVDELVGQRENAVEILQAIQEHYRYLPEDALKRVCELTEITPAELAGVATFYQQFRFKPAGEHHVCVCVGTACHVKGAERVVEEYRRELGIANGEDTDEAGEFTVERVACLGCCTLAPVVKIGENIYGHVGPHNAKEKVDDYLHRLGAGEKAGRFAQPGEQAVGEVRLGLGSCCQARGSKQLKPAVEEAIVASGQAVRLKSVGCVGLCSKTPMLEIVDPAGKVCTYTNVDPAEAKSIILRHFKPGGFLRKVARGAEVLVDRLLTDDSWSDVGRYDPNIREKVLSQFLDPQKHIATEHCGVLDPLDLDEYRKLGGYEALAKTIAGGDADSLVDEIVASGLRGRGGAGFATGTKWRFVKQAVGDRKFVVCNGDEGDPGAFMDRMLLESYPFRVLEGLTLAAFAVGASEGYLYIRAEYPLAVERVRQAIAMATEAGLLGENILGSGFSLELKIMEGAGAFVCGEETALLASIEGKRGVPKLRPPYPAEEGLWGCPTLVNNVETLSNVPWIIRNGADKFAELGTEKSKGTKVFALAGKVVHGGLIEVPMGMTVREIVDQLGGGVMPGRTLKAVQIGGPSGGCVPERLLDTPVDYEQLASVGAIMGSGGLVVLDDTDCMVDIARYFLRFTQEQSCGKCTFCRVGTRRMLEILDRLCEGGGKAGDIEKLEELCRKVKLGSLCGLGGTAPNPVLSTIENFREEYEAHIDGRCPTGVCKSLTTFEITDDCIGCTLCVQQCPVEAIAFAPGEVHEIDAEKCVRCGACREFCPVRAVVVK